MSSPVGSPPDGASAPEGGGAPARAGHLLLGHAAGLVVSRAAVDGVDVAQAVRDDP